MSTTEKKIPEKSEISESDLKEELHFEILVL